jgi:hypothetical protein
MQSSALDPALLVTSGSRPSATATRTRPTPGTNPETPRRRRNVSPSTVCRRPGMLWAAVADRIKESKSRSWSRCTTWANASRTNSPDVRFAVMDASTESASTNSTTRPMSRSPSMPAFAPSAGEAGEERCHEPPHHILLAILAGILPRRRATCRALARGSLPRSRHRRRGIRDSPNA